MAIAAFIGARSLGAPGPSADPTEAASRVVVGTPGGAVIDDPTPTPPPPSPDVRSPVPTPTPEPTAQPAATAAPTAVPPAPVAVPTPAPSPPAPTPAAVVVAVAGPADVVAAFYGAAVDGRFDAAYTHWSDRMRAAFPRPANLDQRFDTTAAITFHQLEVAEASGASATVQANFTETYDSGASRQFIGYWRLVQVDGRWLLDEPHY